MWTPTLGHTARFGDNTIIRTRETRTLDGLNRPFEGSKQKAQRRDTVLISIVSHESFFLYANLNGVGINSSSTRGSGIAFTQQRIWRRLSGVALETYRGLDTSIGQRRWFYVTDTW